MLAATSYSTVEGLWCSMKFKNTYVWSVCLLHSDVSGREQSQILWMVKWKRKPFASIFPSSNSTNMPNTAKGKWLQHQLWATYGYWIIDESIASSIPSNLNSPTWCYTVVIKSVLKGMLTKHYDLTKSAQRSLVLLSTGSSGESIDSHLGTKCREIRSGLHMTLPSFQKLQNSSTGWPETSWDYNFQYHNMRSLDYMCKS